jgi:hypothetical protein
LSTAAGCPGKSGLFTVKLSREDIQRRLDATFPVDKQVLLTRVVLSHPKVVLTNGSDRIGVGLDVRVEVPIVGARTGSATLSGGLDYRRDEKGFFLRDPRLDRAEVQGLTAEELAPVKAPLESGAAAALTVIPVYQFKQRNLGEITAEHVLRRVYVKDGNVYAELGLPSSK